MYSAFKRHLSKFTQINIIWRKTTVENYLLIKKENPEGY